jgi:CheY-like chemotaxis protein
MQVISRPPSTAVKTILVVDDDHGVRRMLRALLTAGQRRVVEACDGLDALVAVRRELPDLVLLDVHMPGLDGVEVCRRIKSDLATRRLPILMVTAAARDEDRERGVAAGADAYLTKPFRPLALLHLIDEHLAGG